MDILIGADPEFFVKKDGQLVSAHGLVSGTKSKPLKVNGGAVQVDGMALEFNINPASTATEFVGNISMVLDQLKSMVPGYEFDFSPVAEFGEEYIRNQPNEAKELGCDPDFNAYNGGQPNPKPNADFPFRTASGHIHIGWTKDEDITNPDHLEACMMVTKQLDMILGTTEHLWCEENKRKELYGAFGAYRPKPYGVEYRVLSNAWLRSPKLQTLVFESTKHAVHMLYTGRPWYNSSGAMPSGLIRDAYYYYESYLLPMLTKAGFTNTEIRRAKDALYNEVYKGIKRKVFLA